VGAPVIESPVRMTNPGPVPLVATVPRRTVWRLPVAGAFSTGVCPGAAANVTVLVLLTPTIGASIANPPYGPEPLLT